MNTKTEYMALSPKHTLMDENTSKGNAILRGTLAPYNPQEDLTCYPFN